MVEIQTGYLKCLKKIFTFIARPVSSSLGDVQPEVLACHLHSLLRHFGDKALCGRRPTSVQHQRQLRRSLPVTAASQFFYFDLSPVFVLNATICVRKKTRLDSL